MITAPNLENSPILKHGFFTRKRGVSTGIYASMNCGYGSNDKDAHVTKNRSRVLSELNLPNFSLVTCNQVHSTEVIFVDENTILESSKRADGMVTNLTNVALGILTADCAPILFADTKFKIIGAAHAGWRGALNGIVENTIIKMVELGSKRDDIIVAVGPCIGPKSYEVGSEFVQCFIEMNSKHSRFFKSTSNKEKYKFDLRLYIHEKLKDLGIQNIHIVKHDTMTNRPLFFSYRRSIISGEHDYGRQISVIALEK